MSRSGTRLHVCLVLTTAFAAGGGIAVAAANAPAAPTPKLDPAPTKALDDFLGTFWIPGSLAHPFVSDQFYEESDHASVNGHETADFWWHPNIMEAVLDAYELTGDTRYRTIVSQAFDGFVTHYPIYFDKFNDDLNWVALACARSYEATRQEKFKRVAIALADRVQESWDNTFGGGVWWTRDLSRANAEKNVCTNATFAMTNVRIYWITGDPKYLARAKQLHAWLETMLVHGGHVSDNIQNGKVLDYQFTYNYGVWIGANLDLALATGDSSYVDEAVAAATTSRASVKTDHGILCEPGPGDGSGFKMIYTRQIARLVSGFGHTELLGFLCDNAAAALSHQRPDGLIATNWAAPSPPGPLECFSAITGAAVQIHAASAILAGTTPSASAEAEDGTLHGLGTETRFPGYSGTGYVAGWHLLGQSVEVVVPVAKDGTYTLALRYSAALGPAVREVSIDGAKALVQEFPGTRSWSDWHEVILTGVALRAGSNTVTVSFGTRSRGWINLDRVDVR